MTTLRKDAERNRVRIVEAATRLHALGQPLQLNAVAREADVGVGTVYRHFATIAQLEGALVLPRFEELQKLVADSGHLSPEQLVRSAFGVLLDDELFAEVATREQSTPDIAQARATLIAALTTRLTHFRAEGTVAANVTAGEMMMLLCGLAHALRNSRSSADPENLLGVILHGILSAPPQAGAGERSRSTALHG